MNWSEEVAFWNPEGVPVPHGYREINLVTASGMISNPFPGYVPVRFETFEEKIQREAQELVEEIAPGWPRKNKAEPQ